MNSYDTYRLSKQTFMPGYGLRNQNYHNVGQLRTPYIGKELGSLGDYGPPKHYPNQYWYGMNHSPADCNRMEYGRCLCTKKSR